MTATDELRRLLDERGVEWTEGIARPELTQVRVDGKVVKFHPWQPNTLKVSLFDITPEQAIAATLGSSSCTNDCTNSERTETLTAEQVMAIAGRHQPDYCSDTHVCFDWQAIADELNATLGDVPRLPHFWTHDGTLHIELPKLPESISVRLPDQRDREVRSARTWLYTRDSGTCKVDVLNTGDCAGYECSEYIMHCNGCGHEFGHVLYNEDGDVWMSEKPRYCPNCGRKVVDA